MSGEEYCTVIEPNHSLNPFNWRDFWRYRELLYILVWRDIKVRYNQTFLGAAWAIFQPLVSMVILTLVFGVFVRLPSDNLPYPIFVYAGLLPWMFFSNGLGRSSMSLLNETSMISKIYFPRLIVPISSFGVGILDFVISFLLMVGMMFYYGITPTPTILIFPLLILITLMAAVGVGVILAALTVTYRDVKYITPFMIQLLMYATPVIYPVSVVPPKWQWVLSLNPMSGLIDGCRAALVGNPLDWSSILLSTVVSFVVLVAGLFYFKKVEYRFADII